MTEPPAELLPFPEAVMRAADPIPMSSALPVFLVGLRAGRNAMIDEEGHWRTDYIPAYARRFDQAIFSLQPRMATLTL